MGCVTDFVKIWYTRLSGCTITENQRINILDWAKNHQISDNK